VSCVCRLLWSTTACQLASALVVHHTHRFTCGTSLSTEARTQCARCSSHTSLQVWHKSANKSVNRSTHPAPLHHSVPTFLTHSQASPTSLTHALTQLTSVPFLTHSQASPTSLTHALTQLTHTTAPASQCSIPDAQPSLANVTHSRTHSTHAHHCPCITVFHS
jgi:hypothetical protein